MISDYEIESEVCYGTPGVYFNNEGDLERFLREETDWSEKEIIDILEHERAHFNRALELGYKPRYLVQVDSDLTKVLGLAVDVPDVTSMDLRQIALAPSVPSFCDRRIALRIAQRGGT